MHSRLIALVMLVVFGPGLCLAQDDKKDDKAEKPKAKPAAKAAEPEMVTIYLHYFFPNYCHGYYIGWTMTVPCQVPVAQAKAYIASGAASYGTASTAPALPVDPWTAIDRR